MTVIRSLLLAAAPVVALAVTKVLTLIANKPAGPSSTFTLLVQVLKPILEKCTGSEVLVESMQVGADPRYATS